MSVREYIGARYVPIFSDPIQWNADNSYEPLTVVMNQGTSYVSKRSVPAGIEITNDIYWLRWADYNAQLEEYIRQVQTYSNSINELQDALPISEFDSTHTIDSRLDSSENAITILNEKFPIDASNIQDNAIIHNKIANRAVGLNNIERSYILIGDSWGQGYTPDGNVTSWISDITAYLQAKGCVVRSKALGGAGLISGTKNWLGLLTEIVENLSTVDKEEVCEIICAGGYNDITQTLQANYNSSMNNLKSYVINNLPNATLKIVFIGNSNIATTGQTENAINMYYNQERYIAAGISANVAVIPAGNLLNGAANSCWSSDGYHPNRFGQQIIAAFMKAMIEGYTWGYNPSNISVNLNHAQMASNSNAKFVVQASWLTPGVYVNYSNYIQGILYFNNNIRLYGDGFTPITFTCELKENINLLKGLTYERDITVIVKRSDNKYQTVSGLLHLLETTTYGIGLQFYPKAVNADGTNYLDISISQMEFM